MEENQSILSLIGQFKIPFALSIVALTFISAGIYYSIRNNSENSVTFIEDSERVASSSAAIVVHIAGAVVNPGLYSFSSETRIGEAIEGAGGLSQEADLDRVNKTLNYAQILTDGIKIYIPSQGETSVNEQGSEVSIVSSGGGVNINSSSKDTLMGLTGIGEVRAEKIIDNRPYTSLNELLNKKIIPSNVFEDIKDEISL